MEQLIEETEQKLACCSICKDTKHDSYCEHVKTRVILDPETGNYVYAIIGSLDLMKTIRSACKCYAASASTNRRRAYNTSKKAYLEGKNKTINANWKKISYLIDLTTDDPATFAHSAATSTKYPPLPSPPNIILPKKFAQIKIPELPPLIGAGGLRGGSPK